ncbi:MAG: hypothetical protein AB1453_15595 [Chloroflexota bacterium]
MKKRILDIVKWIWIVGVIGVAGYYFYKNYQDISGYLESISIIRLLGSFVMLMLGKLALSEMTRYSLKKIDVEIAYTDALTITSVTQLGKYLPGGIWHIAGKFGIYKARQISLKKSTQAIVFENIWLLSSALVIGAVLLLLSSRAVVCAVMPYFCRSEIQNAFLVLFPTLWVAGLYVFEKIFFKNNPVILKDFLAKFLLMIAIWFSFGVSFWLVFPLQSGFLVAITGAFSLSWVAGYVAFFAPGGIGVREYLLTLLLASFFSSSEVAIYATIHRLIWVLEEILLGAGTALIFGVPLTSAEEVEK